MKTKYTIALIISHIALGTAVARKIKIAAGPDVTNQCIQKCKEVGEKYEKHSCGTFFGAGNCNCICK